MRPRGQFVFVIILLTATGGSRGEEPTPPPAPPPTESAPAIPGWVSRALFTSDIQDHEPVDKVTTLSNDRTRVMYFTEIRDMNGQTVWHRWEYDGKIRLELPIRVGSSRWRAYSIKTLDPAQTGEWKASLVDAAGASLCVNSFTYMKKSGAAAP